MNLFRLLIAKATLFPRTRTPIRSYSKRHPQLEQLETRELMTTVPGVQLHQAGQYMLELINHARANPVAEAARLGVDLNEGLPPGTNTPEAKPPLAANSRLLQAIAGHLDVWVAHTDFWTTSGARPNPHTGLGDGTAADRNRAAGYDHAVAAAENLTALGQTGPVSLQAAVDQLYGQLFRSPYHRRNIFGPFSEAGVAVARGELGTANLVVAGQNFADDGGDPFVTGVVYRDLNSNGSYDIGEGVSGEQVTGASIGNNAVAVPVSDAGGYSARILPGSWTFTVSGGPLTRSQSVQVVVGANTNVKVDFAITDAPASNVQVDVGTVESTGSTDPQVVQATDGATSGTTSNQVVQATDGAAGSTSNQLVQATDGAMSGTTTSPPSSTALEASPAENTTTPVQPASGKSQATSPVATAEVKPDVVPSPGADSTVAQPLASDNDTSVPFRREDAVKNVAEFDFGDLPDNYGTLLASDGARHRVVAAVHLGTGVDGEADGLPTEQARGDNDSDMNDEDGVQFLDAFYPGGLARILVTASAPGKLNSFFDFNGDGDFTHGVGGFDRGERLMEFNLRPGRNGIYVRVPADAQPGSLNARFRYSTAGNLGPNGSAEDGDVEDYQVKLASFQELVAYMKLRGLSERDIVNRLTPAQPVAVVIKAVIDEFELKPGPAAVLMGDVGFVPNKIAGVFAEKYSSEELAPDKLLEGLVAAGIGVDEAIYLAHDLGAPAEGVVAALKNMHYSATEAAKLIIGDAYDAYATARATIVGFGLKLGQAYELLTTLDLAPPLFETEPTQNRRMGITLVESKWTSLDFQEYSSALTVLREYFVHASTNESLPAQIENLVHTGLLSPQKVEFVAEARAAGDIRRELTIGERVWTSYPELDKHHYHATRMLAELFLSGSTSEEWVEQIADLFTKVDEGLLSERQAVRLEADLEWASRTHLGFSVDEHIDKRPLVELFKNAGHSAPETLKLMSDPWDRGTVGVTDPVLHATAEVFELAPLEAMKALFEFMGHDPSADAPESDVAVIANSLIGIYFPADLSPWDYVVAGKMQHLSWNNALRLLRHMSWPAIEVGRALSDIGFPRPEIGQMMQAAGWNVIRESYNLSPFSGHEFKLAAYESTTFRDADLLANQVGDDLRVVSVTKTGQPLANDPLQVQAGENGNTYVYANPPVTLWYTVAFRRVWPGTDPARPPQIFSFPATTPRDEIDAKLFEDKLAYVRDTSFDFAGRRHFGDAVFRLPELRTYVYEIEDLYGNRWQKTFTFAVAEWGDIAIGDEYTIEAGKTLVLNPGDFLANDIKGPGLIEFLRIGNGASFQEIRGPNQPSGTPAAHLSGGGSGPYTFTADAPGEYVLGYTIKDHAREMASGTRSNTQALSSGSIRIHVTPNLDELQASLNQMLDALQSLAPQEAVPEDAAWKAAKDAAQAAEDKLIAGLRALVKRIVDASPLVQRYSNVPNPETKVTDDPSQPGFQRVRSLVDQLDAALKRAAAYDGDLEQHQHILWDANLEDSYGELNKLTAALREHVEIRDFVTGAVSDGLLTQAFKSAYDEADVEYREQLGTEYETLSYAIALTVVQVEATRDALITYRDNLATQRGALADMRELVHARLEKQRQLILQKQEQDLRENASLLEKVFYYAPQDYAAYAAGVAYGFVVKPAESLMALELSLLFPEGRSAIHEGIVDTLQNFASDPTGFVANKVEGIIKAPVTWAGNLAQAWEQGDMFRVGELWGDAVNVALAVVALPRLAVEAATGFANLLQRGLMAGSRGQAAALAAAADDIVKSVSTLKRVRAEAQILKTGIHKGKLILFDPKDPLFDAALNTPNVPGKLLVFGHANELGMAVGMADSSVVLNGKQLFKLIEKHPDFRRAVDIDLYGCKAGAFISFESPNLVRQVWYASKGLRNVRGPRDFLFQVEVAPHPGGMEWFVGRGIKDIVFYRDRNGFLRTERKTVPLKEIPAAEAWFELSKLNPDEYLAGL